VNGAFEETKDDVIILNTDTVVATDWIDRLVRAAKSRPQVASVTPFSNNATIVSYPEFCAENPLPSRNQIGQLDAAFARLHAGRVEPIPTGVGFCMFIAREALDTIGGFDAERFGRGYGEENDFCLRASAAGWMHLAACDVYVGHSGGASFGGKKRERVAHALAVLENLHPGYEGLIAGFCHRDPLRNARLAVWAYMLDRSEYPSVLAIAHNRGGGTDKFLRDWSHRVAVQAKVVAARADHDGSILLGPVDAPSTHIRLSSSSASGFLKRYLPKLHISRVFVNHLIDHPPGISSLIEKSGLPFDVMLHDYTYLKGSPTEPLGGGEPDHPWFGPVLAHLLKSADGVFSPSQRAADIYQSALPGLEVVVAPHPEEVADWSVRLSSSRGTVLTVAVVGALSAEKGADLLEQTALLAKQRNLPVKFVLIGHAYRELDGCIDVSGPYQDEQIKSLIQRYRPDLIWLPARWEETYSYTLSVALRSGLPVLVPQIGAFPERLDGRPFSYLYPFDESAEQVC
ncbi:MAG: glycosyl transferase family 2, partial [Proteobacteria bacterium]|nr:glycosyl transferase family 2 [Pseudomonadota bacterium]